jgi:catechol 2,3-dioxygenase-like lactoylglutathione lyase family enzyme
MSTSGTPLVTIALDVESLERSCAFYSKLGFEVVATARPGLIFETRTLRSTRCQGVALELRAAFGKRVIGTQPGAVRFIALRSTELARDVKALDGHARWVGPAPKADDPELSSVQFLDPDAYQINLVR